MANSDSIKNTFLVAFSLCVVCSVIVSAAAVLLRPTQQENKQRDIQKNILMAAGIYDDSKSISEQFSNITVKLVDLNTGQYSDEFSAESYDQRKAEKDPNLSKELDGSEDIAGLSSRERYAKVYLVEGQKGLEKVILPIRGYGLWSTLRGFLALESDLNTVQGIGYYEHAETPGLGGEVDNPNWKSLWIGKKVYDQSGEVAINLIKGSVDSSDPRAAYKVDGLSGATLTSNGVNNMMTFWLGDNGFRPFIENLKEGGA